MHTDVCDILSRILDETVAAGEDIGTARDQNAEAPLTLRDLAQQQTDAFVDLARHYLPNLSHHTMRDSWQEVRGQIQELLLLRDDQARQLRSDLSMATSVREKLQAELDTVAGQLDQAKLDLSSKTGNFKRALSLDPAVTRCIKRIDEVDLEIQQGICRLDAATADAQRKLPDYEACSLFNYLRDREYGSPCYQEQGLERRWDRWVADLIDYDKSKASFDYLNQAPLELQKLIDEKRDRYKELLKDLADARERAMSKYGIQDQSRRWQSLGEQQETLRQELERAASNEDRLQAKLDSIEGINGDHYQQAIEVYRKFLSDLDPEILRVYAACTDTPVDDEVCARLRKIADQIETQQDLSQLRLEQIVQLLKYRSGLREVADRLHAHLQERTGEVKFSERIGLADLFSKLRNGELSPDGLWLALRAEMIPEGSPPAVAGPFDSLLMAAAPTISLELPGLGTRRPDIDLSPACDPAELESAGRFGFCTLAICRSDSEATALVSLLAEAGIRSLVHNYSFNPIRQTAGQEHVDQRHVMVGPEQLEQARELLLLRVSAERTAWTCQDCRTQIDAGAGRCWQCGRSRKRSPKSN